MKATSKDPKQILPKLVVSVRIKAPNTALAQQPELDGENHQDPTVPATVQ